MIWFQLLQFLRLVEWLGENVAVCAEQDIFGLFFDKKDVHYQVSKARRDSAVKSAIKDGILGTVSCDIAPSAELVELREKVSRCVAPRVPLRCCVMVQHDGEHYLDVPHPFVLPFLVPGDLRDRLKEVSDEFGAPCCKGRNPSAHFLSPFHFDDLPFGFEKDSSQMLHVAGKALPVWSLRRPLAMNEHDAGGPSAADAGSGPSAADAGSGPSAADAGHSERIPEQVFVLHNNSASRVTLPAGTVFCNSLGGRFMDRSHADTSSSTSSSAILWPWALQHGS